ncbi:MAG: cytochrome c biogenesis CcdA family protein [Thermoproteota archaeon]
MAGAFTFFSPCSYPLLPAYMLYYLGGKISRRDAVQKGLIGVFGIISVFFSFGLITAYLGLLVSHIILIKEISGSIMIFLGFMMLLDAHLPTLNIPIVAPRRKDLIGLFLFGAAYGFASVSCSLAIFISIVSYGISRQGFLNGLLLIVFYSLGIGVPMILFAIISTNLKEFISNRYASATRWIHRVAGFTLLSVGLGLLLHII